MLSKSYYTVWDTVSSKSIEKCDKRIKIFLYYKESLAITLTIRHLTGKLNNEQNLAMCGELTCMV